VRTGILPSLAGAGRGEEGLICTVTERSILPDLIRVALLRVFGNSSYWYIVNVHKILSPAGANTLVDSCCLSVSTTEYIYW
jgi:hypothetical protein